jgi:hypothetical protein
MDVPIAIPAEAPEATGVEIRVFMVVAIILINNMDSARVVCSSGHTVLTSSEQNFTWNSSGRCWTTSDRHVETPQSLIPLALWGYH